MPIVASTEVLAVTSSWLEAFVLLAAAHTAAWASGYLLRNRLAAPIDGGLKMMDGRRLLGDHKTWRGLIAAVLTCALASAVLGRSIRLGLSFGMWSMSGDAASSFLKRRLRLAPGASIPGLDQVPEALTPLVALSGSLGIGVRDACALTALFVLTDLAVSPIRRRLQRGPTTGPVCPHRGRTGGHQVSCPFPETGPHSSRKVIWSHLILPRT